MTENNRLKGESNERRNDYVEDFLINIYATRVSI